MSYQQVIEGSVDSSGNISPDSSSNFTVSVVPGVPNDYYITYSSLFDNKPVFLSGSDVAPLTVSNSYRTTHLTGGSSISFRASGKNSVAGLYTIKRFASNTIIKLNPITGAVDSFLIFKLLISGVNTPSYGHALTADPTDSNSLYAVVSLSSSSPPPASSFRLIKVNILNKTASVIGSLSDRFSSLTCSSSGQLYGILGQDAVNSMNVANLYAINKTTGATTLLTTLSQGVLPNAYQLIGINSNNGLLYHLYGNSPNMTLESWDPSAPLTPPVSIGSAGLLAQWTGIGFYGDSDFVGLIVGSGMKTVNTSATVTSVGPYIGATTYGLAVVKMPNII